MNSREEAIEWALRAPDPHGGGEGQIEIRQVFGDVEINTDPESLAKETELRRHIEQQRTFKTGPTNPRIAVRAHGRKCLRVYVPARLHGAGRGGMRRMIAFHTGGGWSQPDAAEMTRFTGRPIMSPGLSGFGA